MPSRNSATSWPRGVSTRRWCIPPWVCYCWRVAHTVKDKTKLLNRVRRLKGQLAAVEKALVEERECDEILHTLAACRGAIGALTAEVMEGHVRGHIADPDATSDRSRAARQLIDVIKKYLR
jgi:DNA-binding FrmR family transcriptional regulator